MTTSVLHSSSPAGNVILILTLAAMVVAGVITAIRHARNPRSRSLELEALNQRLKFDSFNPERDDEFVMGWGFLSRLAQGEDCYAFNILRGTYHEQALFVFDYHYRSGSGKNEEGYFGTMLMLVVKEAFPRLTIGPEDFALKFAEALGVANDIKFESAEFSRRFRVRSADKKFAYDVCNAQMIDYLLANPGLQVEIQGPVISLVFEPQLPVGQIEFNLQRLVEIRSRLPEYLFTQNA
jgi:hypothetical protein